MKNYKKESSIPRSMEPVREKENPLDKLCNSEQRRHLKKIASCGACIIITGDKLAPYQEFFRGIRMYMRNPTFNGVAMYDTHIVYKNNWLRPLYLLTLNDVNSSNILHSIQKISGKYIYSLHLYDSKN